MKKQLIALLTLATLPALAFQLRVEPMYASQLPHNSSLPYPPTIIVTYQPTGESGWVTNSITNSFEAITINTTSNSVKVTAITPIWNALMAGTNPVHFARLIYRPTPGGVIDLSITNYITSTNIGTYWGGVLLDLDGAQIILTTVVENDFNAGVMAMMKAAQDNHVHGDWCYKYYDTPSPRYELLCATAAHQPYQEIKKVTTTLSITNNFVTGPDGLLQVTGGATNAMELTSIKMPLPLANGDTNPPPAYSTNLYNPPPWDGIHHPGAP